MPGLSRLAVLVLAFCLAARGPLRSETIRLLSGEHQSFTRLVLVLDRPSGWQLGRTADGYGLKLARNGIRVDLTRAFELIPRMRVTSLSYDAGTRRLDIASTCDCHVQGFQIGDRTIVVDVTDGAAPAGHPFDQALAPPVLPPAPPSAPRPAIRLTDGAFPPLLAEDMRRRYDLRITVPSLEAPVRISGAGEAARPDAPSPTETEAFRAAEQRRRVARIEAELLRQLARAGSQGMVRPNPEFRAANSTPNAPEAAAPTGRQPATNVDAITGVDRAAPEAPEPAEDAREACLEPDLFAFLAHEAQKEPHQLIADARLALLREFDRPDTGAASDLTRAYLYLGFGAEARQVIDAYLASDPQAGLYTALAAALDDTPDLAGPGLTGQVGCPGPVSFWAMLAGPVPAVLDEATRRATTAAASDLPLHLRRWVVPRLAQRLLAHGHDELAAALRDSLDRVEGEHGTGYLMLQAALAERGDIAAGGAGTPSNHSRAAAETILEQVAESNDAEAPEALVDIIRLREARGQVPPPERFDLAEALIFEHRGTAVARALRIAIAPAYARDGAFDEAFDHLDAAATQAPDQAAGTDEGDLLARARSAVALRLAENASDEIFLRTMFDPARAGRGAAVSPDATFALAARLLALGFPEQALAQSETLPPESGFRLMRVRALLALGRDERALAALAGLQGAESDALRGEILARLGEHDRAHVLSRVAGDEAAARRAAWASGDPEAIRSSGSESEADFTEATRPENAPSAPPEPSLIGARDLLEGIRARRSAVQTLLEEKSAATGTVARTGAATPSAPES